MDAYVVRIYECASFLGNVKYTNLIDPQVGYREGITAGKEGALQEGFDAGFAHVGVPVGRDLGNLRGIATAILSCLNSPPLMFGRDSAQVDAMKAEARDITSKLSNVRFSDIAPRDLEAEEHAREHLEGDEMDLGEEITSKRDMEGIEDMLAKLTAGANPVSVQGRPTMQDVHTLKARLQILDQQLGLGFEWS